MRSIAIGFVIATSGLLGCSGEDIGEPDTSDEGITPSAELAAELGLPSDTPYTCYEGGWSAPAYHGGTVECTFPIPSRPGVYHRAYANNQWQQSQGGGWWGWLVNREQHACPFNCSHPMGTVYQYMRTSTYGNPQFVDPDQWITTNWVDPQDWAWQNDGVKWADAYEAYCQVLVCLPSGLNSQSY